MIKTLYDGWSLVRQPNSSAALHLYTLLCKRHAEIEAMVALPGQPPDWFPAGAIPHILPTPNTVRARLIWEQRSLPGLAKRLKANLLHLLTPYPPLFGASITVVSPAEYPPDEAPPGFIARLRLALASGGKSRLRAQFMPADLASVSPPQSNFFYLPVEPILSAVTDPRQEHRRIETQDIPNTYILYHGPTGKSDLRRLLNAWSWAAGSIGTDYPLLILGMEAERQQDLLNLLVETDLVDTVHSLPVLEPSQIAQLYKNCSAVFHPAPPVPWGSSIRLALAYGKPLVAPESTISEAMVGAGAYLVPQENSRALGAALISVIVDEELAQKLVEAGNRRAIQWNTGIFQNELYTAYLTILSRD